MKKIFLALLVISMAQTVTAAVSSGTDSRGTQYYYSSFPMPGATWKTKIAIKASTATEWTVATVFYYYGNGINGDIITLRNYLTAKKIQYKDGVCITFPYTTPCLR